MIRDKYASLIKYFDKWSISISDDQLLMFDKYYELLIDWNTRLNLTAITDFDDVIIKHFVDSVSIASVVDLSDVETVIDVGTGAGFPGIPLKIMFPHLKVTLLDSLNKRLVFLNEVINELSLTDIYTVHGRAEDVSRETLHREMYDLCVSRAVANLSTLTELCTPFVKKNGVFASYKSEKADDEITCAKSALFLLGCSVNSINQLEIENNTRNILIISKDKPTPKTYPRKAGTPAKKPL